MLVDWIHDYETRRDTFSLAAHRALFESQGVPLPKYENNLFCYMDGKWWHPKSVKLDGREYGIWLNLCIAADLPLPATPSWSIVRKYQRV